MPPPPPLLHFGSNHHQRSSPTSSGVQQQHQSPQPGYPTGSMGSMDEPPSRYRRVNDGQSPSGLGVTQERQQPTGYPIQQYQSQNQAHWYGQPTNVPSRPTYGSSSTSAGPSYIHHAHHARTPTGPAPMYAPYIPTRSLQWTGSNGTQGQDQYYYTGAAAYSQPMQAYQQPPYTSPTYTTGTYQAPDPPGPLAVGLGLGKSHDLPLPLRLGLFLPVRPYRWLHARPLHRRRGLDLLHLSPRSVPRFLTRTASPGGKSMVRDLRATQS